MANAMKKILDETQTDFVGGDSEFQNDPQTENTRTFKTEWLSCL